MLRGKDSIRGAHDRADILGINHAGIIDQYTLSLGEVDECNNLAAGMDE